MPSEVEGVGPAPGAVGPGATCEHFRLGLATPGNYLAEGVWRVPGGPNYARNYLFPSRCELELFCNYQFSTRTGLNYSGTILELSAGALCAWLGHPSLSPGTALGPLWNYFGTILELFWNYSG